MTATKRRPRGGVDPLVRLNILHTEDAKTARDRYLRASGLDDLDEQTVVEQFEERLGRAIGSELPEVAVPVQLAEAVALILKARKHRAKPRLSRVKRILEKAAVGYARQRKADIMQDGRTKATEAELQAADEASAEFKRYGVTLKPGTIRRRAHNRDK